jgi:hypothetical protein
VGTRKRKKPARASSSRRDILAKVARWPAVGAYVSSGWRESGSAGLVMMRQHPEDGRIAVATFYVDLWCMGVKTAKAELELDAEALLEDLESSGIQYEDCAPELVAAIVEAGDSFARGLGLSQDPELPVVREMLRGLDPAEVEPVVPGKNGLPMYVPGQSDDVAQVLRKLERALGPEAYHAMIQRMQALQMQHNPELARRARELQRAEHDRFVVHFGSDEVIVPGAELKAVLEGFSQAREGGPLPGMDVSPLVGFDSVGLLSDPDEGLFLLPHYGEFRASFERPEQADLEVVEGFLESDSIGPQPFLQVARAFPEGVDRVLGEVTGRPDFRWERDGEGLLRVYKATWCPRPSVAAVPRRLSEWKKGS